MFVSLDWSLVGVFVRCTSRWIGRSRNPLTPIPLSPRWARGFLGFTLAESWVQIARQARRLRYLGLGRELVNHPVSILDPWSIRQYWGSVHPSVSRGLTPPRTGVQGGLSRQHFRAPYFNPSPPFPSPPGGRGVFRLRSCRILGSNRKAGETPAIPRAGSLVGQPPRINRREFERSDG